MKMAVYCNGEFKVEKDFDTPAEYEAYARGYIEGAIAFGAGEGDVRAIAIPPSYEPLPAWWRNLFDCQRGGGHSPNVYRDLMMRYGR